MSTTESERKSHWEKIYQTKQPNEVSWYQKKPLTSLELLKQLNLPKSAKIFDNGGGDSLFVDNLLQRGYKNISVLDISETALNRAKLRLGPEADKIKWIVADEAFCNPDEQFDLWYDRAAFHFLTGEREIANYIHTIESCIKSGGYLIMETFSDKGPKKCSGLDVKQYSENSLHNLLKDSFEKLKCITVDHITPSNTTQNFLFCIFKRK
jgi:ubiquinone/menaquinone biosynthesis C-methylase UbiE